MWVLRHAKAAPHGPEDHGRPLTGKGRRQAAEVERFLAESGTALGALPGLVLSSSALRALETAEVVVRALGDRAELVVDRRLYEADPDDVVDVLRTLAGEPTSVMVVGHNPTLHEFALALVGAADPHGRARLEKGFPTGALAVIRVPVARWAELSPGSGELATLFTPGR